MLNKATRTSWVSITACGQGLTVLRSRLLTAAHTVVFAELSWVPGQMIQAEDRVHRIGQEEMVDVHYCIAQGSFDEYILGTLNKTSRDTTGILVGREQLTAPGELAPSTHWRALRPNSFALMERHLNNNVLNWLRSSRPKMCKWLYWEHNWCSIKRLAHLGSA